MIFKSSLAKMLRKAIIAPIVIGSCTANAQSESENSPSGKIIISAESASINKLPVRAPSPDAFAEKSRIFVLTDIGNEPDDQMSFVRLLVYANEIDIEGVAAVTSTWL